MSCPITYLIGNQTILRDCGSHVKLYPPTSFWIAPKVALSGSMEKQGHVTGLLLVVSFMKTSRNIKYISSNWKAMKTNGFYVINRIHELEHKYLKIFYGGSVVVL